MFFDDLALSATVWFGILLTAPGQVFSTFNASRRFWNMGRLPHWPWPASSSTSGRCFPSTAGWILLVDSPRGFPRQGPRAQQAASCISAVPRARGSRLVPC